MITLSHISKTFDGTEFVIDNLSLEIASGEFLVLLGSSGSGKTTLLKMINRLVEPSTGKIEIDGQNIASLDPVELKRSIGYVFQGIGLFPHFTVEENITIVLKLKKITLKEQKYQAHELLELVNLAPHEFANRYPCELSGGQQQRVGVARALATHSNILLMDEPFGALDAINRALLQDELLQLKKQLHKTIIFVTHDIFEALRLGDRIAVLNKGKLEQVGQRHEILQNPASSFVQQLFSQTTHQLQEFADLLDV